MKVEHITLAGNSVIRNTESIHQATRLKLDILRLSYTSGEVTIPTLPFKLRITATQEGAAFDLIKGGEIAVTNFCCFEDQHKNSVLSNIRQLADMYNRAGLKVEVKEPVTAQWLYSTVINPFALSPDLLMLAGEVELYIYEQLFLARNKNKIA